MNNQTSLKVSQDDFEVEFEIFPSSSPVISDDSMAKEISNGLDGVYCRLSSNQEILDKLNKEIDRLTNHADGLDYMVAVGSGLLAGLIDSFWVGPFDFKAGKAWSNKTVNEFVMKVSKSQGYSGDRLDGAIKHLEGKFKIPSDNVWKGKISGVSPKSHHIDDLAHHPTPIGMFFSILTQFTNEAYFQNGNGNIFSISTDENGSVLVGNDIPCKIFAGTVNWFFHLISDMSGSNKTAGVGMGIPGPILSLAKELSMIPGINSTQLSKKIKHAFTVDKFDFRSELAIAHQVGRQAVPVIINEVVVRTFYFIRRLVIECKSKPDFSSINWSNTIPWKNRTINRMLTIATGTFTLVDLADAGIRAGLKTGGLNPAFAAEFLLHVNFVGVGRFAIAVGTDVYMGAKRSKFRSERMAVYSEQLQLMNVKIFYLQADVWMTAETTEKAIERAYVAMERTYEVLDESLAEREECLDRIGAYVQGINQANPKLMNKIANILEWE